MLNELDYERYQRYLRVAAKDCGVPCVRTLDVARVGWGIRHLSPLEFRQLANAGAQDSGLRDRWRERIEQGYYRERLRVEDDIEDLFAHVPEDDRIPRGREDAA